MKYIRCLAIICAVALTGTTSTLADCGSEPKPPDLPHGAIAGPEEMKKALDSTAGFDVAVKNYADCLVAAAQEEADFIAAMQEAAEEYNRLIAVAQAAMDERNAFVLFLSNRSMHHKLSKKSFPLSSTTIKAGKSSTSIFHIASIPRSSNAMHSTFLMQSWASRAPGPPTEPK